MLEVKVETHSGVGRFWLPRCRYVMVVRVALLCCMLEAALLAGGEPTRVTRETMRHCDSKSVHFGCCLPLESVEGPPIVDFMPEFNASRPLRVRKALQCLDGAELAAYAEKLDRAYGLMRALPHSDPRSLHHQNIFHCTFITGSLFQDGTDLPYVTHNTGLFGPWHRYLVYFHERIIQSLLGDPDFTLHFWNFDNSLDGSNSDSGEGCFKVGHHVPPLYADPTMSTYSERRAIAQDPTSIADLTDFVYVDGLYVPKPDREMIALNRQVMHSLMINQADGKKFMGEIYRAGIRVPLDVKEFRKIMGRLEFMHLSVHRWGGNFFSDLDTAAADPLFYALHCSVDRLFELWPQLGSGRSYPVDDPDFMDAEFLFYDENKVIRRVMLKDSLSVERLGYTYEKVNDESWMSFGADDEGNLVGRVEMK